MQYDEYDVLPPSAVAENVGSGRLGCTAERSPKLSFQFFNLLPDCDGLLELLER